MTAANDQQFCIDCSDDENYDNNDTNDRVVDGKRVWEPKGTDISRLYRELEAKGFIELRWMCPGRRSPSVHNLGITPKPEPSDGPITHTNNHLMNEFDFEADFNGDQPVPVIGAKGGAQPKRRAPGPKKQTNLNKVMADIKKYQFIDHTKRLTIQTTTTPPVPTPTSTPTPPTTAPMTLASTPVPLPTPTAPAPSTPTTASSPVTPLLVTTAQSILTTTTTADSLLPSTVTMSVTPVTTTSTPLQSLSAVRSDSPTDIL